MGWYLVFMGWAVESVVVISFGRSVLPSVWGGQRLPLALGGQRLLLALGGQRLPLALGGKFLSLALGGRCLSLAAGCSFIAFGLGSLVAVGPFPLITGGGSRGYWGVPASESVDECVLQAVTAYRPPAVICWSLGVVCVSSWGCS